MLRFYKSWIERMCLRWGRWLRDTKAVAFDMHMVEAATILGTQSQLDNSLLLPFIYESLLLDVYG